MLGISKLGGGAGALLAGAVVVAVGAVVLLPRVGETPEQASLPVVPNAEEQTSQPSADIPVVPTETATASGTNAMSTAQEDTASKEEAPLPPAPSFDVVRVDAEGAALIAGAAPPRYDVAVELDGIEITRAKADGGGSFAALFNVPLSDKPQVIWLLAYGPDGAALRSADSVILAPQQKAPLVAENTDESIEIPDVDKADGDLPVSDSEIAAEEVQVAEAKDADVETPLEVATPEVTSEEPAAEQIRTGQTVAVLQDAEQPSVDVAPEEQKTTAQDSEVQEIEVAEAEVNDAPNVVEIQEQEASPESLGASVETAIADVQVPEEAPATPQIPVETPQAIASATQAVSANSAEAVREASASSQSVARTNAAQANTAVSSAAQATAASTGQAAAQVQAAEVAEKLDGTLASNANSTSEVVASQSGQAAQEATQSEPATRAAPAILLAGSDGVRLLQPAGQQESASAAAIGVRVEAIGYDADGAVSLTGRASEVADTGAALRVYLNNEPLTDGVIAGDGSFAVELPNVKSGVYTLRVDQIDPETGKVSARFETPFQREDPVLLAARTASTVDPDAAISATAITVQPGFTLWGIASDRYGDGLSYVKVFEANKDLIRDPDLIYPGQVFDLPK